VAVLPGHRLAKGWVDLFPSQEASGVAAVRGVRL
jgi:hypothetical protein